MVAQKNIIKNVKIGVNTPSLENGLQLKNNLDFLFKEKIFPKIDDYFNSSHKIGSQIIRVDTIEIEVFINESNSLDDLELLIINEIKNKIDVENISAKNTNNYKIITNEENESEIFFHFLKHGILPWWFDENPNFSDKFLRGIIQHKNFSENLKLLLNKKEVRKRLILQFDDAQLFRIASSFLKSPKVPNLNFSKNYRNLFWEIILIHSIEKDEVKINKIFKGIPLKDVEKIIEKANEIFDLNILSENLIAKIKNAPKPKISEKSDNLGVLENYSQIKKEGILVKNAGLVLLHPFLKMFFENMDFLSGKYLKPEKIDEAVHTLHYLATGREQAYEHELVFEKFLCNLPFNHPINRHILLTMEQKIACEILMEAVLGHWTALKSNSSEILQNEFLQREGKLTISGEKQHLFIQRKTQDILLDKLPWNIHLIKIPWIKKLLYVDW